MYLRLLVVKPASSCSHREAWLELLGDMGGFFWSVIALMSMEFSAADLSSSPSSPLTPGDVLLFPLDDYGAVQSQPQEFHFYGEDLRKSLSK